MLPNELTSLDSKHFLGHHETLSFTSIFFFNSFYLNFLSHLLLFSGYYLKPFDNYLQVSLPITRLTKYKETLIRML